MAKSLTEQIREDSIEAAKSGKKNAADILKVALSSLKNAAIDNEDRSIDEAEEMKVVFSEAKKLKEEIKEFEKAERNDLSERAKEQLEVLEKYLPDQADEAEIEKIVEDTISELGAESMADMGKVMGSAMDKLEGKADGGTVSSIVKKLLGEKS